MAAPTIQLKRGNFASLPALKAGEPAFTSDKFDFYIGLDNDAANNKFFGSHRYWLKETTTAGSGLNLVEGTNNGVHAFTLKAPASLAASYSVTFPNAQGAANSLIQNDGSGNLSWTTSPAFESSHLTNLVVSGIGTIATGIISATTDSTNKDTGALVVEGGVGIEKSVHVGAALSVTDRLYVGGQSEFIGIATFRGGTVRLGDSTSDNIYVGGEFKSNLVPDDDDSYDLGSNTQEWRNIFIDGTAQIDSLVADTADINAGTIDNTVIGGSTAVAGSFANLICSTSTHTGTATFTGQIDANGDVNLGNATSDTITATGRFDSNLVPSSDDARDLGTSTLQWKDLHLDGTANIDVLDVDNGANIAGGLVANTVAASNLNAGRVTYAAGSGQLADSANLTFNGTTLTAHTLSVSNNATITGNLTVLGTQSILNTETLKVEDSLIEVGLVNSGGSLVAPSSDADIDVGIVMHYYSGSAKKAAVYWDDSAARVVVGSDVSESSSVMTAAAYAALEIGSLWVKDADGQEEVIGVTGSTRILHNITVDGGSF